MKSPKIVTVIIFALCLMSCSSGRGLSTDETFPVSESDDFSVSGVTTQYISIDNTGPIIIRCYCQKRSITRHSENAKLTLVIAGTHSSVGYHGTQDKPDVIAPQLLRFAERREGNSLILESKEYTYIHHAFIIDDLQITAPAGIKVIVEPISYSTLEGR